MKEAEPRRAAAAFQKALMKLILEFCHQDWDITMGEIIGQLEVSKAVLITLVLEEVENEDSDN